MIRCYLSLSKMIAFDNDTTTSFVEIFNFPIAITAAFRVELMKNKIFIQIINTVVHRNVSPILVTFQNIQKSIYNIFIYDFQFFKCFYSFFSQYSSQVAKNQNKNKKVATFGSHFRTFLFRLFSGHMSLLKFLPLFF